MLRILRYRFRHLRNFPFSYTGFAHSCQCTVQKRCTLMMPVHMEYMIRRRLNHLWSFCENDRLQYIYHLCKICHLHAITVLIKDIQGDPCNQRIPYRVLLI